MTLAMIFDNTGSTFKAYAPVAKRGRVVLKQAAYKAIQEAAVLMGEQTPDTEIKTVLHGRLVLRQTKTGFALELPSYWAQMPQSARLELLGETVRQAPIFLRENA